MRSPFCFEDPKKNTHTRRPAGSECRTDGKCPERPRLRSGYWSLRRPWLRNLRIGRFRPLRQIRNGWC